jgi:hypothetical protein
MIGPSPGRLGRRHDSNPGRQGERDYCRGEQSGLHGSHLVLQRIVAAFSAVSQLDLRGFLIAWPYPSRLQVPTATQSISNFRDHSIR